MKIENLKEEFLKIYPHNKNNELFSFLSPGRVNLIGEHTDYNGGFVFPFALTYGTFGVVAKRNDNILNFASLNMDLKVTSSLENIKYKSEDNWANYLKGVVYEFQQKNLGNKLSGLDILIYGEIPNGSGLSSSASIEVLMAVILNNLFDCNLDMVELVKMSQRAENNFIGVNSGIMDQFAIGMGKKDNGIFLDTNTLKYTYVPILLENHTIIISNTNKKRALVDSKYNERRLECETAVELLNKKLDIKFLGDISIMEFENNKHLITDPVILKRATHVVYEIKRTLDAVEVLKQGDLKSFGKLMTESGDSLKNLYEVTGLELDTLVEESLSIPGTLGSRMTGAGFGGCTVSLVENNYIDQFIKEVGENYTKKIGYKPDFYLTQIGDGAKQL